MPDQDLADEIVRNARRTLSADSARIELARDIDFQWTENRGRGRRRGGLLRQAGKALKAAGKAGWKAFLRRHDFRHQTAEGMIEPRARRHMLDYGGWAEMLKDGVWWAGPSGQPLSDLDPDRHRHGLDVWWLLDALLGTTAADDRGEEDVRGTACRRLHAAIDLSRASDAAPGLRVPTVECFQDLLALPIEVWIDDAHVRRVRFREGLTPGETTTMLELWDFGVATGDLDWSRLPALGPPG
jgi:hypothetical protein